MFVSIDADDDLAELRLDHSGLLHAGWGLLKFQRVEKLLSGQSQDGSDHPGSPDSFTVTGYSSARTGKIAQ
jgi:hypothetical protein